MMTTLGHKNPKKSVVLKAFELLLHGFDGGTDETDHLVKWVKAPSLKVLERWLDETCLSAYLQRPPEPMPHYDDLGYEDGIDVVLDLEGKTDDGFGSWIHESQQALMRRNRKS
jgi:hypothetical protein